MRSFLSSEKVNTGRQFEVDSIKFFAVPFMVCIHFYEQFGAYGFEKTVPDTVFRNMIEFIGGPLAAPVFMFCMGVGIVYSRRSQWDIMVKRGITLYLLGILVNIFELGNFSRYILI